MAPGCWRRMELVVDVVVRPVWTCLFETHNPTHTQHEHHDNNNNQRASVRFCALLLPFSFSSRLFFMTWHYEHHCCCHDDITVIEGPPSKNSVFCSFLVAGFPCLCFRCFLFVHSPVCVCVVAAAASRQCVHLVPDESFFLLCGAPVLLLLLGSLLFFVFCCRRRLFYRCRGISWSYPFLSSTHLVARSKRQSDSFRLTE